MIYSSKDMESRAVLDTAAKICAAARTAPKTRGMDGLVTCVLTGEDKSQLAAQMRKLADELDYAFFTRDADNVEAADAVVLFGMEEVRRGLDAGCQYCHFESCADCTEKDGLCAGDAVDVGIAIGSGFYEGGILATGFIMLAEQVFSRLEYRVLEHVPEINVYMEYEDKTCLDDVLQLYRRCDVKVLNIQITRAAENGEHNACAIFTLRLPRSCTVNRLMTLVGERKGIVSVEEL